MELTGKCRENFQSWLFKVRNENIQDRSVEYDLYYIFMYMMPDNCKTSLIIEWFDSVGIYILIEKTFDNFWFKIKETKPEITKVHIDEFDSGNRQETTLMAIKKANELYNLSS